MPVPVWDQPWLQASQRLSGQFPPKRQLRMMNTGKLSAWTTATPRPKVSPNRRPSRLLRRDVSPRSAGVSSCCGGRITTSSSVFVTRFYTTCPLDRASRHSLTLLHFVVHSLPRELSRRTRFSLYSLDQYYTYRSCSKSESIDTLSNDLSEHHLTTSSPCLDFTAEAGA